MNIGNEAKTNYYYYYCFMLCEECYWCASCIRIVHGRLIKCPECNSPGVKSMPIFDDKTTKIDYNAKRVDVESNPTIII
jgi:hypothetical protein